MNPINPMGQVPFNLGPPPLALPAPTPPPLPHVLRPFPHPSASFWTSANDRSCLEEVQDSLNLAKALYESFNLIYVHFNLEYVSGYLLACLCLFVLKCDVVMVILNLNKFISKKLHITLS